MTIPRQQRGNPTAVRKVPLRCHVATPERRHVSDDFYAAEVEASRQSVCLMPPITPRVRGPSAKDFERRRWLLPYGAVCNCATSDGKRVMTKGRAAQFFLAVYPNIGFFAGHLVLCWPPKHFANRPTEVSHVLDMRRLTWLGLPDIQLIFHKTNTVLNAFQMKVAHFTVFWRLHRGLGTLQFV